MPALERWAREVGRDEPRIVAIALFGSYARGDWGVGSDADVLVLHDADGDKPRVPDPPVCVPVDVVVMDEELLEKRRRAGHRFARVIDDEAQWLYQRPAPR